MLSRFAPFMSGARKIGARKIRTHNTIRDYDGKMPLSVFEINGGRIAAADDNGDAFSRLRFISTG
jgi:hypothetical protein